MLFGIAFYSYTITHITFFFTSKDDRKTLFKKWLEELIRYSNSKELGKELRESLIKEIEFASLKIAYWWLPDEINFLNDMPLEFKF